MEILIVISNENSKKKIKSAGSYKSLGYITDLITSLEYLRVDFCQDTQDSATCVVIRENKHNTFHYKTVLDERKAYGFLLLEYQWGYLDVDRFEEPIGCERFRKNKFKLILDLILLPKPETSFSPQSTRFWGVFRRKALIVIVISALMLSVYCLPNVSSKYAEIHIRRWLSAPTGANMRELV